MKKYAIEVFFDNKFDNYVRNLWKQCDDQQLSSFMNCVQGTEPHIALAVYENVQQNEIEEKFKQFIEQDLSRFRLVFDAVAVFRSSMVTYLQPNTSKEFMDLMIMIHDFFHEYEEQCHSFYSLERWFPHTTIGKNNTLEEGIETLNYIVESFTPQIVEVERLVLVEIHYVENKIYCRNLVTKELLDEF